jgi:cytochrome c peroxidase
MNIRLVAQESGRKGLAQPAWNEIGTQGRAVKGCVTASANTELRSPSEIRSKHLFFNYLPNATHLNFSTCTKADLLVTSGMRGILNILILQAISAPAFADAITDADYRPVSEAEAKLGQLLFYDPILSGNRNISCATCHHPDFATGDGVSLSIGEGGIGLGAKRLPNPENMPEQRIPRHAQALFNLGAHEFKVLFHDGRIEVDPTKPSGFRTPLDEEMLDGFATLLSAQTMFPVLSADEMAGHYSENDVAKAVRSGRITGTGGAWDTLAQRIQKIPTYSHEFKYVYDSINVEIDIDFTDISNAIAAFIEFEWRSDQSPYDAFLRGQSELPEKAARGLNLFEDHCATCHAGPFQTDHKFHAMGVPQFGPGKAARFERHARDTGRLRVTGNQADAYAFRTPSLRNVAQTAPYGHTGAYPTLRSFVTAHLDPVAAIDDYAADAAILPKFSAEDWWVKNRPEEIKAIQDSVSSAPIKLTTMQIDDIIAFLNTLSDPTALSGRLGIPDSVPSGLPIDR